MTCRIGSPIALGVAAETHVYVRFGRTAFVATCAT